MRETRAEKFGRAIVNVLRPVASFYSVNHAKDYMDILAAEVDKYSFRKRKVTEPVHEGCFWSMESLERIDVFNPVEAGLFVKECFDQTYNKDRALNMFYGFISALENLRDDVVDGTL